MKILKSFTTSLALVCLASGMVFGLMGCSSEDRTHETSGETINDDLITSHVMAALQATSDYKYSDVQANTFKGKVQLSGFVDTGAHKDQAAQVAKQVEGVKDVINNITVE